VLVSAAVSNAVSEPLYCVGDRIRCRSAANRVSLHGSDESVDEMLDPWPSEYPAEHRKVMMTSRQALAQEFLSHIGHFAVSEALLMLSPNVTYQVLGSHPLSGTFSTPKEVLEHLIALAERTTGTFDTYSWVDWMIGESHVACIAQVRMQSVKRHYNGEQVFVVGFDDHDLIDTATVFFMDEKAAGQFFGDA
jgi:hypothetical protein